jgi:protein-disulfide isomerase
LITIHQNAYQAALAAESAGKQGKFFQMVNKLFETQENWSETKNPQIYFEKTAQELKLDINKFKADMKNQQLKNKIQENISSGQKLGINSTPTFFLNGQKLEIASLNQFIQALKNAP